MGLGEHKKAALPRGENSKPHTGGHAGVTEISAPDRGSRTCKGRRHSISTSELQVIQNAWFTDSCGTRRACIGPYPEAMAGGVCGSAQQSCKVGKAGSSMDFRKATLASRQRRHFRAILWLGQSPGGAAGGL